VITLNVSNRPPSTARRVRFAEPGLRTQGGSSRNPAYVRRAGPAEGGPAAV
jgi:hypothetical protein